MSEKCTYCEKESVYRFKGKIPCCLTHYHRLYNYGDPHYKRKTNEYKTADNVTYLKTSKGIVFKIDTEEHDKIKGGRWTTNASGYLVARKNNRLYRLHRVIMNVQDNPDVVVDHIDGNLKNNLKSNLRVTTQKYNSRNTSYHHNAEVKYPGIRKRESGNYQARIYVDGKEITLGTYETKEEAIKVRIKAEKKYFGEYAYNNRIS